MRPPEKTLRWCMGSLFLHSDPIYVHPRLSPCNLPGLQAEPIQPSPPSLRPLATLSTTNGTVRGHGLPWLWSLEPPPPGPLQVGVCSCRATTYFLPLTPRFQSQVYIFFLHTWKKRIHLFDSVYSSVLKKYRHVILAGFSA